MTAPAKTLGGVVVPAITPTDADDRVAAAAFAASLDRLVSAGVHGIFVGGSAGEGPLLREREWRRMVEIARETVGDRLPLLGGAIDTSTSRVVEKISVLHSLGFTHAVVTPTYYLATPAASEHLRLFAAAVEAAGDMEVVAYNIPACTGTVLAVETVCELARRGWVRRCKDSSGDLAAMGDLVRRGREFGLAVLGGDEQTAGDALLGGAAGIVPVCANYEPETFTALYAAGVVGDAEAVARSMRRVRQLREALVLSGPCWLSGIKHAVSLLGIGSGAVVSPLEPAPEPQRRRIAELHAGRSSSCRA